MRSLFFRLSSSHLLVALGSLALLLFIAPRLFLQFYLTAEERRLTTAARGLARAAGRLSRLPEASTDLALLVRTSEAVLGGEVALLNRAGDRIVMASHPHVHGADWALEAYRDYHKPSARIVYIRGQAATILLVSRSTSAEGPVGTVVIRRSAAELQTMIRALHLMTVVSAALASILAVLLSLLLSRAIASPLVTMSRAAQQLAAEDFSVKVPEQGPAEVASLASSLNRMAASLERAFSAVASERQRLAEVLATMAEGVIAIDGNGEILVANRSARQLLNHDLPMGSRLADMSAEDWVTPVLDTADGGASQTFTQGRESHFLSFSVSPRAGGGAVVVVADVTAARRLELLRREFVASASHELRAPLTSIRGFLGALLDGTATEPEEREHCLRVAASEAQRMTRLVEELLELSRLQAGVMEFEFQPTQLEAVINGVIQSFAPSLEAKGVRAVAELTQHLPRVSADGERLAQVFVNLLDNALRFSPRGGKIVLRSWVVTRAEEMFAASREAAVPVGAVACSVSDEGPGIPPGDLRRIWERFHKADASRTRTEGGAGLGLAIVREIIRTHAGDVFAHNRAGGGAEVGFWLPLSPRTVPAGQAASPPPS